jgi:hypothetical protein
MSRPNGDTLTAYANHELTTAQRMKHWPILLVREYRRLEGIARTVQARDAAEALGSTSDEPSDTAALVEEPAAEEASGPTSENDNLEHALKLGELDALAELEAMDAETRLEGETAEGNPDDAQSQPEIPLDDDQDVHRAEPDALAGGESQDNESTGSEDALQEPARRRTRLQTSLRHLPLSREGDQADIREEADLLSQLLQADLPAPGSGDPDAG